MRDLWRFLHLLDVDSAKLLQLLLCAVVSITAYGIVDTDLTKLQPVQN